MTDPMDVTLGKQRYWQASVSLEACDGQLDFIPSCGGLQGDPYVARQWAHSFRPLVDRWYIKYFALREDAGAFFFPLGL